jgi:hypothetical protein
MNSDSLTYLEIKFDTSKAHKPGSKYTLCVYRDSERAFSEIGPFHQDAPENNLLNKIATPFKNK